MGVAVFFKQVLLKIIQEVLNIRQNVFLAVFLKHFSFDTIGSSENVFKMTEVDLLSLGA